jgi:acetolactate synthase I/II/III large subunit
MATVADLIAHRLRDAGVGCIFGVPGGGSNLDLIDAAARAGLPFVLTSTETAAAIAATAQAEAAGRPGACLTTLGPGAASVVNGVACAWLDRAPVIVFTDSHPAAARDCLHQRLDQQALLAPITKWSATLTAEDAETMIAAALARATDWPQGPVHLDCPGDVLGHPARRRACVTAGAAEAGAAGSIRAARPSADFVRCIQAARKPLLVVGLGARRPCDADAIRSFCGGARVPAMVTYKAKGVVPDDHPWFGGVFTNAAIERPLLDQADLLIGVGLDPVELIPRPWTSRAPIVACGPWAVDDRHVPFAAQLVAEVAPAIDLIETHLPPGGWDQRVVSAALDDQRARISTSGGVLSAARVIEIASARLAPVARVTVDAGAHMFPATMLWPADTPNQMLISNGLSTMGFALPAAIGAALTDRTRPVVALTGDGGLLMCAAELVTAVRERLRIIAIVFADEALSLIQIKQERRALRPAGVALGAVAWTALAESCGAAAFKASDEAQLDRAVEQALAVEGPSLIEARIDPAGYGQMLRAVRG